MTKTNKCKKIIFDRKLFIEGIHQLSTLGIICLVLNLIIGIIIPIGYYLSAKNEYLDYLKSGIPEQFTKATISPNEATVLFVLISIAFTPLMIMSLFKFLNNRSESDFYHSLPHTKRCIFFSFAAAEFAWMLANIIIATSITALLYSFFTEYLLVDISKFFIIGFNTFILCLLIGSVMMLAVSLSGNMISCFLTFIIIFFLPRIATEAYKEIISSALPYISSQFSGLLNIKNNLLYAFINIFTGKNTHVGLQQISFSTLYTAIISILAFVFAQLAFVKRKSETAETAMNGKFLQGTFRTIFVLAICMIPITLLFNHYVYSDVNIEYNYNSHDMYVFYIIISYIGAVMAMIIYELLTTKSLKSALKTLKTIPIIAVLNLIVFVSLILSFNHYLKLRLDPDDVQYIKHAYDAEDTYYNNNNQTYFSYLLSNYKYTDKKVIDTLCNTYNEYADNYQRYINGEYTNSDAHWSYNTGNPIVFSTKDKDYTLSFGTNNEINNILSISQEYQDSTKLTHTNLPSLKDVVSINLSSFTSNITSLKEEELKELYQCLCNEVKDVDFNSWYTLLDDPYNSDWFFSLRLNIDDQYFYLDLPITTETPKTLAMLIDFFNDQDISTVDDFIQSTDSFEELFSNNTELMNILISEIGSINTSVRPSKTYVSTDTSYKSEDYKKIYSLLKEHIKPLDEYDKELDSAILLNVNFYNDDGDFTTNTEYIFAISTEILDEIMLLR